MKIAIIGSKGKLGSSISSHLKTQGHSVIEIDISDKFPKDDFMSCDAALDASIHTNTIHVAKLCNTYKIPLLIACTGHSKRELEKIKKTCVNIPCEICPNLSLGFSLVIDFLKKLTPEKDIEACIYEQHHKEKKDAPSGTALALKAILDPLTHNDTEIVSSRFSKSLGNHKITLDLGDETIIIEHTILSRNAFARGSINKLQNLIQSQKISNVMSDITCENYEKN